MAHKKGQGSSRNGRDSNGQRRGMKVFGGQTVTADDTRRKLELVLDIAGEVWN